MTLSELRVKLAAEKREIPTLDEMRALPEQDKTALAVGYAKIGKALDKAKGEYVDSIHEQAKFLFVIKPDADAQGKTLAKYYQFKTGCDRKPENRALTLNEFLREMVQKRVVVVDGRQQEIDGFLSETEFDKLPVDACVKTVSLYKKGVDKNVIAVILKDRGKNMMKDLRALDPDVKAEAAIPTIEDHLEKVSAFVHDSDADKLEGIYNQLSEILVSIGNKAGDEMLAKWMGEPKTEGVPA